VSSPRVRRAISISGSRVAIFVQLRRASEVDAELRGWLSESWATSGYKSIRA